jgi:flagellum-specific peptidoglycan hydrolase FlgJ
MGRFMSPDWSATPSGVPYAQLGDPQSLNLYGYVRNNPLIRVDLDGHIMIDGVDVGNSGLAGNEESTEGIEAQNKGGQNNSQDQQQNSTSKGTSFWHGLSNLFHLHSWNYVKTKVTATQTDQFGNVLLGAGAMAPMANPAAVAMKAAAQAKPAVTPPPSVYPDPTPTIKQLPKSQMQELMEATQEFLAGVGETIDTMASDVIVCISCNDPQFRKQMYPYGDPNQIY